MTKASLILADPAKPVAQQDMHEGTNVGGCRLSPRCEEEGEG